MTDKINFGLSVIVDPEYTVISNGSLTEPQEQENGKLKWRYDLTLKPMSSYLAMIAVGKFDKEELTNEEKVEAIMNSLLKDLNKRDLSYIEYILKICGFNILKKEYYWKLENSDCAVYYLTEKVK